MKHQVEGKRLLRMEVTSVALLCTFHMPSINVLLDPWLRRERVKVCLEAGCAPLGGHNFRKYRVEPACWALFSPSARTYP